MIYKIYQPAPPLRPYIDVYWQLSGKLDKQEIVTLMPDGGINLVVNLGDYIYSSCFETRFDHENILLIGPLMRSDVQILHNEVLCFGVRFRPGAFSYFYNYDSIDQVANDFHEFPRKNFPDLKQILTDFSNCLDQFFIHRLTPPKFSILECLSDIYTNNGLISIENLAKKHFTSERQLERLFKQHLGLSPKKFANLERFHKAFKMLSTRSNQSIDFIAWECGYYDHAHMTNDFKRFTGQPPTAFILSDLSKTIANESS